MLLSTDVDNLISGSSAFFKSSLNIWKFSVHILLKRREQKKRREQIPDRRDPCGQRQKRLGKKGFSAQQFDFEGRTDGAEREGTTVKLLVANCRRSERAVMELPVLHDQLPMKVKGEPRPRTTLLTESGVRIIIHRNSKITDLKSSTCQNLCYYHVEMLQLVFYPPPSPNLPVLTSAESPNGKIHFQNWICHLTGHPTLNG